MTLFAQYDVSRSVSTHGGPPNPLAKDWVESLLQNCSKERMMHIAKEIYKLPNASSLNKEPLYHAIFNHMLTIQVCTHCG